MNNCSGCDFELPLVLIESELFDVTESKEGIGMAYSLGLINCIHCLASRSTS